MPKKPTANFCRFHPVFSCDPCSKGARQTNIGSSTHLATLGSRTFQVSSVGSPLLPSFQVSPFQRAPVVNFQMNPWKTPVTPVVHWFIFAKFPDQNGHKLRGVYRSETPFSDARFSCSRARHPLSSDTSGRRFVSPYLDRLRQGRGDMIRRELRRTGFDARNPKAETNSQTCLRTRKPKPENPQTKTRNRLSDLSLDVQAETRNPKLTLIFHTGHKTRNMKIPRWALTSGKAKG